MKLSVKIGNDKSIFLTVPDNATVEDLKIAAIVSLPNSIIPLDSHITPKDINLWYSGYKLDYSKSLNSYHINPDNLILNPNLTIHLTFTNNSNDNNIPIDPIINQNNNNNNSAILDDDEIGSESQIVKKSKSSKSKSRSKSKSKKCNFSNCTSTPLRIVGDCQFCQGKFCSKHRLLESHNCKGLKICKDKCYERNALKLQSEQTVASKV